MRWRVRSSVKQHLIIKAKRYTIENTVIRLFKYSDVCFMIFRSVYHELKLFCFKTVPIVKCQQSSFNIAQTYKIFANNICSIILKYKYSCVMCSLYQGVPDLE